jgi:bifunctional DNA-binding transcriptional regulator/antitoxin component of YhaV-PrlF toxin-antitoxin module
MADPRHLGAICSRALDLIPRPAPHLCTRARRSSLAKRETRKPAGIGDGRSGHTAAKLSRRIGAVVDPEATLAAAGARDPSRPAALLAAPPEAGHLTQNVPTPCCSIYGSHREKGMNAVRGRVSGSGRLSIPAEFRKAVGLDHGGDVVVELAGREIRIRTVDEVIAQSQALTRRLIGTKPDASVDDFLAERQREAELE